MSLDQHRRDVERHMREIARLQDTMAKESAKAVSERKRAQDASIAASKAGSAATMRSKISEAQRHDKAAADHDKKVADGQAKIAAEHRRLNDSKKRLDDAERQSLRKLENAARVDTQNRARELSVIRGVLSEHRNLHHIAMSTIEKMQRPPKTLTVLFLAANPLDEQHLRLDEEVRSINEMIRKSEHRDAVKLESRWAVRPLDVLQAINECRPRILHFSGHGSSSDEIIFQDNSGNAKAVSKEAIVQTIVAGSDDIQLVFFNTCYSKGQAQEVVLHVPAAIGMNTAIGDEAARVFAAAFYSSIGFGHSVGRAFRQAKAALMLEDIAEEDTPELFVAEGMNADEFVLVSSE